MTEVVVVSKSGLKTYCLVSCLLKTDLTCCQCP